MNREDKGEGTPEDMSTEPISSIMGANGASSVTAALKRAGDATGVGFDLLYNMAARESSLNPSAKAKTSSAAGLFQFIEQTWFGAVKKYGAKHGLSAEASAIKQTSSGKYVVADAAKRAEILNDRFDPMKAAALAGELINENKAGLERRLGRAVDAGEVYAAHFLGVGGASKLLSASSEAKAADLLPKAAAANRPVFYDGARARTVSEVMASIGKSMGLGGGEASAAPTLHKGASLAEAVVLSQAEDAAVTSKAGNANEKSESAAGAMPPAPERKGVVLGDWFFASKSRETVSPLALAVLQALDPSRMDAARANEPLTLR